MNPKVMAFVNTMIEATPELSDEERQEVFVDLLRMSENKEILQLVVEDVIEQWTEFKEFTELNEPEIRRENFKVVK